MITKSANQHLKYSLINTLYLLFFSYTNQSVWTIQLRYVNVTTNICKADDSY